MVLRLQCTVVSAIRSLVLEIQSSHIHVDTSMLSSLCTHVGRLDSQLDGGFIKFQDPVVSRVDSRGQHSSILMSKWLSTPAKSET